MATSNPAKPHYPQQRWQIHPPQPEVAQALAKHTGLSPVIAQVMLNRGITTAEQASFFLDPDAAPLTDPLVDFPDLQASVDILVKAIADGEKIAICGDYDAVWHDQHGALNAGVEISGRKR
ncbi:MAG: hypothetical protein HC805_08945 [Alkalinema sp. RL_2_19]|nr:hypothetical protein [Alkalinema sp. RL_2_19]